MRKPNPPQCISIAEVLKLINLKYSQETHDRVMREEGREEGIQIVLLYQKGASIKDIADKLSVTEDKVQGIIKKYGITR